MRPALFALTALAVLVAGVPTTVHAQSRSTSAIRGFLYGPDSAPIVGATVTVRHAETGAERSGLSNQQGAFLILLLSPGGPYTVTVQHLAYAEGRVEQVMLPVGETFTMEMNLEEQALELEGIEVAVDRATIFTPNQVGPATRLTEAILDVMPILSRDVMELAVLSPLVKTTRGGGFSVAGQNDRYNAILVDGLVSKDMFGLTAGRRRTRTG